MEAPKTMLHALEEQAARLGDRPALWSKRNGEYRPTSWTDYQKRVKAFALGLRRRGFAKGQVLAIIGFNREEWLVADLAAMALGGVPLGIYTTSSPEQVEYILAHSEARVVVVENAKYLATVEAIRSRLPRLERVVVMEAADKRGDAVSYEEILAEGAGEDDALYWESVHALQPDDLATLIYTSGTTGHPKGVMLSHRNISWTSKRLTEIADVNGDDSLLSYLPLSHIAEQTCTLYGPITIGAHVYFAESLEKLPENLREVRPSGFFGVPRVWEKFKARAEERIAEQPPARRRLVGWARRVALERHRRALRQERIPLTLEGQYQLAQRLVFSALKARIGLDRARIFVSSAAPISQDVLDFFASVDIVIREIYGQSEVTGPTSVNTPTDTRIGTVGRPLQGVEVRLAEDGEVLVRGPNVCLGYYKEPAATRELVDEDGWLHSGDLGSMDEGGYLRITGRKKEIIVTSGGKKTAPANIEELLKAIRPIGNALVVGERRNYLVALLALDAEKAAALARERGWPGDARALADHPELLRHLDEAIEREVNPKLAKFETIKRFAVLPEDFSIEAGELTPTLKVKRKVVEAKYASTIERLYA